MKRWQYLIVAALAIFILATLPRSRITQGNYAKIKIGMTGTEVRRVLSDPDFIAVEAGMVNSPSSYSLDRESSHQYRREQWTATKLNIVVIFDSTNHVVCRYTTPGEKGPSWFRRLLP